MFIEKYLCKKLNISTKLYFDLRVSVMLHLVRFFTFLASSACLLKIKPGNPKVRNHIKLKYESGRHSLRKVKNVNLAITITLRPNTMISPTRKRVLFILCVFAIIALMVRYLIFNGSLLAAESNYRRSPGAPVLIMVFYEALCPDSKHFILKQLLPAYKEAAPLMEIQLVPYGKAQTFNNPDGTYRFDCQHGPVECQANTYHACAIEAIEEVQARLDIIACMIRDNRLPKEALHRCAKQHNIESIDLIQKCYDSSHGGELLKLNGDATHALRPQVSFIPTITLDGSQGRQAAILKNLIAEVCKIASDTEQGEEICKNHH